jgi:hypothetical protein
MKYKLLFWILCPLLLLSQNKKDVNPCNCGAVLLNKQQQVPLLDNKGNIISYIMDDTIKEDYFGIFIFKISHNLAYVSASATLYDTIPRKGWIQTKYLGIYPSSSFKINLYSKPDIKSKIKSQINKPEYYPFNIIDCKGNWLYVKYLDADNKYKEGWLSPHDQCSNPYSTCN